MRLAERRGVLTGPSLSRVQSLALEMLIILDNRDKAKQFVDTLRTGIVAANPASITEVFPEWYPDAKAKQDQPDEIFDESTIPASPVPGAEELADIEQWLAERTGQVSSADLGALEGDVTQWH